MSLLSILDASNIMLDIKGTTKEAVIAEMIDFLAKAGKLEDRNKAYEAVMAREKSLSTGMRDGIALPHGKSDIFTEMIPCVAISSHPVDFDSLDGKPATLFIMTLSPQNKAGPHLQFLAEISSLFKNEQKREALKSAKTPEAVLAIFRQS